MKNYFILPDGQTCCYDGGSIFAEKSIERVLAEGGRKVTRAEWELAYHEGIRKRLKQLGLKPKATVYCSLVDVSRSGMSRRIKVLMAISANRVPAVRNISREVAELCGFKYSQEDGCLSVGGSGFNPAFHIVYCLGQALWPDGTRYAHSTRNGVPDKLGGYALKHEWI